METFADRLRELRIKSGKTLEDVANDIGLTKATLSRYENKSREPKLNIIESLASYFNVSADYIIGKSKIKNTPDWYTDLPEELQNFVDEENIEYMYILKDAKINEISPQTIKNIIETIKQAKNET